MPRVNLDTHILVYALETKLRKKEQAILSSHEWSVSPIVFWELAMLVERDRLDLDFDDHEVQDFMKRLQILPLSVEVARQSCRLDISSDPADELIAATSVVYNVPLLTRDKKITASRMVPFA
jgi:PIN domain nuclease of toxin-antitoxin system